MKTNLNPSLTKYHNYGYPDKDSEDGYWLKKNMEEITREPIKNKYKDLIKIYDELKGNIETQQRALIGYKLALIKRNIEKYET